MAAPKKKPAKPAMTAAAFKALLAAASLNHTDAATRLAVHRRTIIRWASGQTAINARSAAYIRSVLDPK